MCNFLRVILDIRLKRSKAENCELWLLFKDVLNIFTTMHFSHGSIINLSLTWIIFHSCDPVLQIKICKIYTQPKIEPHIIRMHNRRTRWLFLFSVLQEIFHRLKFRMVIIFVYCFVVVVFFLLFFIAADLLITKWQTDRVGDTLVKVLEHSAA